MNKGDLAAAVADRTGMSKAAAGEAVDAVFDSITHSLARGTEVRILGFGNFAVTHRKASMGRNPQTGQPMHIKASNQAKFKPGKGLKDAVNR
jgi:DNA-binding protein HU-beta